MCRPQFLSKNMARPSIYRQLITTKKRSTLKRTQASLFSMPIVKNSLKYMYFPLKYFLQCLEAKKTPAREKTL